MNRTFYISLILLMVTICIAGCSNTSITTTKTISVFSSSEESCEDFKKEIIGPLGDYGWIYPLPQITGNETIRILTEEEKIQAEQIANTCEQINKSRKNKDVERVITRPVWIEYTPTDEGQPFGIMGYFENIQEIPEGITGIWYPGVEFEFKSSMSEYSMKIYVGIDLSTEKIVLVGFDYLQYYGPSPKTSPPETSLP